MGVLRVRRELHVKPSIPSAPPAPAPSVASCFATLIGVVVLVVPLFFSLLSVVDQLPRPLLDGRGVVHAVEFVGRLVNRPIRRPLDVGTLVWRGHDSTIPAGGSLAADGTGLTARGEGRTDSERTHLPL